MAKRLVVCCDGTWNTPDQADQGVATSTNVTRFGLAVAPRSTDGSEQRVFYHKGVGTGRFDHFRGGALGWGLSRNVQDAYMLLVENFDDGDEIFLVGFSRGAYTARSVAGLIRNSGLLTRSYADRLEEAYELYRDRTDQTHPSSVEARLFRRSFALETRIKFVGVWDTVGALGIPVDEPGIQLLNDRWKFHDVVLSTYVDNAFQALAIDERRRPFTPAIWQRQPGNRTQRLEQVWFAGVHSDVGGGYSERGLADISLKWMATRAGACGLAVDLSLAGVTVAPDPAGPLHDSLTWYYRLFAPLTRPMGAPATDGQGQPMQTCESVASSAVARVAADPDYRPSNLRAFIDAGGATMPV
jgi:uncharacterized protein (DUF2235 family)